MSFRNGGRCTGGCIRTRVAVNYELSALAATRAHVESGAAGAPSPRAVADIEGKRAAWVAYRRSRASGRDVDAAAAFIAGRPAGAAALSDNVDVCPGCGC